MTRQAPGEARRGDAPLALACAGRSRGQEASSGRPGGIAEQKGIAVLLGGVFNSGILATGAVPGARYDYKPASPEILARVRRIDEVCRAHGITLANAAIQFPLLHPIVASVVIGAITPAEIARNIESLSRPIPVSLWDDLKTAGLLRPDALTAT